jgi:glucuronokinase
MQLIRRFAYARAGLLGNPSDGYHGKTISVIVRNFRAQVALYEWDRLEIVQSSQDEGEFSSIEKLVQDVRLHGYYGGIRLIKATIKKFVEYCRRFGHGLHERNFSIRYESNVPRQVGLAGSSAIIVATLRALSTFYNIQIPREVFPSLVLSVEREELNISAGLQDRVIQVYEGLVFMDFSHEAMRTITGLECGRYEPLDPALLPPIYLAYSTDTSEPTEVFHNRLKQRFEMGEPEVVDAMRRFAELAQLGRKAILEQNALELARLIDANFDLRCSLCRLPEKHLEMVHRAREVGASAKFAGSGGCIIGTYPDEDTYRRLQQVLGEISCRVLRPDIA